MIHHEDSSKIQYLKNVQLSSPGMATRVACELVKNREQKRSLFHKVASLVLSILLVITVSISLYSSDQDVIHAGVNSRYVVDIDLVAINDRNFETMEIQLSKGLKFSSKRFPELSLVNRVTLHKDSLRGVSRFPVVVQGTTAGEEVLNVQFYDEDHQLVDSRPVKINFN